MEPCRSPSLSTASTGLVRLAVVALLLRNHLQDVCNWLRDVQHGRLLRLGRNEDLPVLWARVQELLLQHHNPESTPDVLQRQALVALVLILPEHLQHLAPCLVDVEHARIRCQIRDARGHMQLDLVLVQLDLRVGPQLSRGPDLVSRVILFSFKYL